MNSETLLGAVCEKDYISWDDDIDIQICSRDYLRFKETMKKELPPPYRLVEYEEYGNTFFDIYPVSSSYFIQRLTYLKFNILYGLSMGHRFKIDYEKYSGLAKM